MDYWSKEMHDDVDLISAEDWEAGRILRAAYEKETPDFSVKKGQKTLKYVGELIPASLVIAKFYKEEESELGRLETEVAEANQRKEAFEEEHGGDEGALNGLEGNRGYSKGNVKERAVLLKEEILKAFPKGTPKHDQAKEIGKTTFGNKPWNKGIMDDDGLFEELDILYDYLQLVDEESEKKKNYKKALDALHKSVIEKYPELTEAEMKTLVVDEKWFAIIQAAIEGEVERLTQKLAYRINELEGRYLYPMPKIEQEADELRIKVEAHLKQLGLVWE
jgi:type I restriction enzyme M protein